MINTFPDWFLITSVPGGVSGQVGIIIGTLSTLEPLKKALGMVLVYLMKEQKGKLNSRQLTRKQNFNTMQPREMA